MIYRCWPAFVANRLSCYCHNILSIYYGSDTLNIYLTEECQTAKGTFTHLGTAHGFPYPNYSTSNI